MADSIDVLAVSQVAARPEEHETELNLDGHRTSADQPHTTQEFILSYLPMVQSIARRVYGSLPPNAFLELHDLAQKLLSLARSKEVLEEYFHAALVEKYKTVEKMEPWEFDAYAAKSKVNILTVMKSRLLSKRERDKRMGPIEEWHVRSRLLSEFCR